MNMILIADSGATKTKWALVKSDFQSEIFKTEGLHPLFVNQSDIIRVLETIPLKDESRSIEKIYFYGAGCSSPQRIEKLQNEITNYFPDAILRIDTDMVGACKAMCQNEAGITAILGTGSNSAFWNGEEILIQQKSLGYLLGDEGSGANLGLNLIKKILRKEVNDKLVEEFYVEYELSESELINNLYQHRFPNRYLAGFAPFLKKHEHLEEMAAIVYQQLKEFFEISLMGYPNVTEFPIHFIGSVAQHFAKVIEQIGAEFKLSIGNTCTDPMEGLINYHLKTISIP